MTKRSYNKKESTVLTSCLALLQIMKNMGLPIVFSRTGTGKIKTIEERYFKTGSPGWPDITGCFAKRFLGIEIKSENGKQSPKQKETQKAIENAGGIYVLSKSAQDLLLSIDKNFPDFGILKMFRK